MDPTRGLPDVCGRGLFNLFDAIGPFQKLAGDFDLSLGSQLESASGMATDELASCLDRLKRGDPSAMERIWDAYFDQLLHLISRRLGSLPLRVVDEEDIALSALNSFYDGVKRGRFTQLDDNDDLRKILVTIACRKTNSFRDRFFALKRGAGRLLGESVFACCDESGFAQGIDGVVGHEEPPEIVVAIADALEDLLGRLTDSTLRQIATHKVEGYTNEEIAEKLGYTTRTVERKLERIRSVWSAADSDDKP